MSREPVDLSPGQLLKLADLIYRQEVQKIHQLKFNSYTEQQKYLKDAINARDRVYQILENTQQMVTQTEAEEDATKKNIAHDVYEYCANGIGTSLQFIRSYNTRLTFLDKIKTHSDDLIKQLKRLNLAKLQKHPWTEATLLAVEASTYRNATLESAKKFQHFIPNHFTKLLKENKIYFGELVERNKAKLGFMGPFKNLDDIQKLQVYERIIEEAGQGKSVVTYSFEALGKLGVAVLIFTAGAMVWDICTAEDKLQATVRDTVTGLTAVAGLKIGAVVDTAVKAGFVWLDMADATAAITVMGSIGGIGISVLIGMAVGALLDLIFSSGTSNVNITDELTGCRVAPMPDGLPLARLVKHNYPEL